MLLSKLKHLDSVEAIATNIGVVPECESTCQILLHGCPLVSPPIMDYGTLTGIKDHHDQNAEKTAEDALVLKANPYFKGYF